MQKTFLAWLMLSVATNPSGIFCPSFPNLPVPNCRHMIGSHLPLRLGNSGLFAETRGNAALMAITGLRSTKVVDRIPAQKKLSCHGPFVLSHRWSLRNHSRSLRKEVASPFPIGKVGSFYRQLASASALNEFVYFVKIASTFTRRVG